MAAVTEDFIRRVKPPCKPWLPCGDNLYLRFHVTAKGELSRRWFYRSEKTGFRSIGASWPTMGLKDARAEVTRIKTGGRSVKSVATVQELAEDFATTIEGRRYLDKDVLPVIGGMKVRDVEPDDVMRALKPIVRRGARIAANRCFDVVRALFDYGVSTGTIRVNPCAAIRKRHVGGKEKPRERVLSPAEIEALLTTIKKQKEGPIYRLLLLTGLRLNELLRIERSMIEGDVLTLPAALMKARRAHRVYLAPSMAAEIKAQMAKHASRYVFPSEANADKPFPKVTLQQRWARFQPEGVTLHDIRRTMRTECGKLGIRPDVCEMMLAHKLGKIQATYDHYSYDKELRAAWRLWAAKVKALA
jgi:integrase